MSFDLQIVPARPGLTPDEVNGAFERLEAGQAYPFGEPTDSLRACLADVLQIHPPMSPMTEADAESSIWSVDPDCVDGYIGLCMRWNTTPDQILELISIAHKHGFAVHDPQEDTVYMPTPARPAATRGILQRFRRFFGAKPA
jgi:hypothetical protein